MDAALLFNFEFTMHGKKLKQKNKGRDLHRGPRLNLLTLGDQLFFDLPTSFAAAATLVNQ